ncbi:hypothetical protein ACIPWF_06765 [Paenarthrobacter sp. NPDC089989]|uniref:hypothetical protein n=1 Tax=unclassified Paenarthrobacter TaxID=2634190 RepID=UPI0037FBAC13
MEWAHANASRQRTHNDDILPRSLQDLSLSVEDGARVDDAGKFHPGFGYFVSLFGFLAGSKREVFPFDISVTDGCPGPRSGDSFKLGFAEADVAGCEVIIDGFCALIDIWEPVRGAVSGQALAKLHRDDPILYPPVGVLTYFANNSGYTVPESPLVHLRALTHGTVAVLKQWTLEANLEYKKAFAAVNEGIPNGRLRS